MNTIYIDVLIVLNIYVNYFLLKATSKITHSSLETPGLVISSAAGSLFSLVILLPGMNYLLMFLIKLSASVIIILLAFRNKRPGEYIRLTAAFYIINFVFAGIIMGLDYFLRPEYILVKNTFVYADISLLSLVVFTAVSYFIICGLRAVIDKGNYIKESYSVVIKNNGRFISVEGLADTGNSAADFFSGRPVIICSPSVLEFLSVNFNNKENIYEFMTHSDGIKGVRLITYSTIDGTGILPAFHPDEVIIKGDRIQRNVDVMIGIKETSGKAIFNPSILI